MSILKKSHSILDDVWNNVEYLCYYQPGECSVESALEETTIWL